MIIDEGHARLRGHVQVLGVHGDQTHLDVPVAAELLPADLVTGGDDQVGAMLAVDVDAGLLGQGLPAEQGGQATQHAGLGRADGRGAHGLLVLIGVPQVLDDLHAAVLEVGRHRVFVLVNGVLLERVLHQLRSLGLHVGLDEGAEVLVGVALGADVLANHLARDTRLDGHLVELGLGHLDVRGIAAEDRGRV